MELRESDFNDMVLKSDRPVLVDFWASWCPPCKMMQPVIDKLATKVGDWADVYSINIDRSPSLASLYQISGVPTFVAFAGGDVVERRSGALTEGQLLDLLKKAEEAMPEDMHADDVMDSPELESCLNYDSDSDDLTLPLAALAAGQETPQESSGEANEEELLRAPDTLNTSAPLSDDVVRRVETLDSKTTAEPLITIVSGLPRSGTSLMMRMLNAGGIPALCDEARTPDVDNPNGYYEFQDVKSIEAYHHWIDRAPGHAVKMVYSLLKHLPQDRKYHVIFMRRHTDEILLSQRAMLERNGITVEIPDDQLKAAFERELRQFYAWLPSQTHLKLINVSYNELLSRPDSTISHINSHLDFSLNADAMLQVIDSSLYRNRVA